MSSIVPPDLRRIGKNLRAGRIKNFSFAKNFAITTPTTATGPSVFFRRLHQLSRDSGVASIGALSDGGFMNWYFVCSRRFIVMSSEVEAFGTTNAAVRQEDRAVR